MASFTPLVSEAWLRHNSFTLPVADEDANLCIYAQRFAAQAEEICQRAVRERSHIAINQALLQVTRRYWEWFAVVPKSHRTCVEARAHRCIHATFQQTYQLLKALELSIEPPLLFLPAPPPPPAPPVVQAIAGVTLGEVIGEED